MLNPDYHFRNDIHRMILYSTNRVQPYSALDWMSFVHPVQAQILFSFSEPHPMEWHYEDLKDKYRLTPEQVNKMIEPYVENEEAIYTEWGRDKIVFPKNMLLPYDKVGKQYQGRRNSHVNFVCQNIDVKSERLYSGPLAMTLMMTSQCVTKCKYCYADKKTSYDPLPTREILRIIDKARDMNMSYIDVIGGEVFCHKDWAIIIKKLVDADLTPSYISTKVPIDRHHVEMLKETGYDNVVQLSLDSLDDEVLEKTIGSRPGYVQKMKTTIELLEQYGFKIQVDTILTRFNSHSWMIQQLYDYIHTLGNLIYWEIRVPGYSLYSPESFQEIRPTRESVENLRAFVEEGLKPKSDINILFSDDALDYPSYKGSRDEAYFKGGSCGALQSRLFVLPDGKVSICELVYWNPLFLVGDLRTDSIAEVWNSPKAVALYNQEKRIRSKSRCSPCKVLDFCQENRRKCVVKVMQAYGQDNYDYPDPRCEFAPEFLTNMAY